MRTFQTYNAPPPFGYQPANFYAPTPQPPQVSYYPGFNSPMAFGAAPQAAVMAPPTSAWPAPQSRGQQNARGKGKGKGGKRGTEGGKGETSTAPVQSAGVKKSKKQRKREAFDEYKAKKRAEQKERVGAMIARFQERGVPLPPGITLAPGTDGGGNTPAAVGQETSANTQAQDRTGQLTIEGPPPAADGATTESGVSSVREITEDEELAYLASIGPE
ncbi:uncharacterized protein KY384_004632 [Bacidia gigantensis]|uniref:uncharacterized protein n=1 Tax=Bacidia gigantensis TaxID=2732470 RepID=UPI001D038D54|nr:uncharacterized protein KY384_004632 [Bacidia gigantensis]KAG8531274.1 hypothetical protein KY384_004632 [Bacidia gigantensis]